MRGFSVDEAKEIRDKAARGERIVAGRKRSRGETVSRADLGVTATQSHRWQRHADLGAQDFERVADRERAA